MKITCLSREVLENKDVTWNENGTLTYSPKRTVFYVPEMSVGDPKKDIVTVPNIPILVSANNTIKITLFESSSSSEKTLEISRLTHFFLKVRLILNLPSRTTKENNKPSYSLITF